VGGAREADRALRFLDSTSEAGGRLVGLGHSRGIAVTLSFETTLPFDRLSEWQPVRSLPREEQIRALRDPSVRERLVKAAHAGDYGRSIGAEVRAPDYDRILVMSAPIPPHRTVAGLAAERGVDPVELMIDLAVDSDFEQMFIQPIQRHDDDSLVSVMKHPRVVMTFSDSGAHVSQVIDSSIQTHLLAYWVRERQVFTLPEAVQMLTLQPARVWGLSRRGLLREGMIADINIFDPDRVSPDLPKVVADLPGGSKRLTQKATGFLATIVDGQVVVRDGEPTGALPGRLLLGPLAGVR
jgi:N-acyl-D-amino-acid deacylase